MPFPILSNEVVAPRNAAVPSLFRCGCPGPGESPVPSYLHLDGVEPSHLHLQQPVLPVEAGHAEVVNAARDIAERLAILEEAVVVVVNLERPLRVILQSREGTV